ncbi:hypothetical protein KP509_11G052100 [Ceratopteris richardii]|nr:hypothetical protein KP509_11G052100 [Ceratopteris richardii]
MDCKLKIMATRLKYGEDVWFLAAQLVNPYEILPYFAVRVLNRAFFKMWELMQMFPGLVPLVATKPKLLSAHICEGPGGFVEAVCMRRSQHVEKARGFGMQDFTPDMDSTSNKEASDCWFAITLAVPGSQKDCMKMQMSRLKENRSKSVEGYVHYGADKSGDITNPNNISSFVEFVLEKTCGEKMHLITGDGAFDVSEDFSSQEQSHAHLFFSEILIAARLQSAGGALVLKIFDCFTEATWTMLFILASLYTTVEIVRLRTSRVCNSERFVVAQGFRLLSKGLEEKLMSISRAWHQCTKDGLQAALKMYMPCPLPFLEALGEGNAAIASDQSTSILHAVSVAEDMGEKLSFAHASQQKSILSILRRKMKTMELRRVNALTICKALNIPLASSVL